MPMTKWEDVVGYKCDECGGYATHIYGTIYLCCDCHGGYAFSQEDAKYEHEKYLKKDKKVLDK